ncbi:MAG: nucleoside kinase [Bacteroidales bacterium]|nr:nucleoside kinase [Bacteroidales bacterium]MBP5680727.1 nucleoside kinase [Bacteroidales bacterium]
MIQIRCKNNGITKSFTEGVSLLEVFNAFPELDFPFPAVSAKVNNSSQGLKFRVWQNRDVEFVDVRDNSGFRAYVRSLCFVLYKATQDVFPDSRLYMEHPISRGYFCNFKKADGQPASEEDVTKIRERMLDIINQDMPFHRTESVTEEAVRIFRDRGLSDKARLLETSGQIYADYYTLGDTIDYYYGALVPSAGYLKVFGIEKYQQGMLLRVPDRKNPTQLAEVEPQPKTFEVFAENVRWNVIMGLQNVGAVNQACLNGNASKLIQVSEALQEKKIVQIAEDINARYHDPERPVRLVLITGPSSSGKTTFCKRLSIQLMACGLKPVSFSTDDYFVNREDTPKFPDGRYDFENIKAVDNVTMERDLKALLEGKKVEIPEFNFTTGKREYNGKRLQLGEGKVLLIEGIHALNPTLTAQIADEYKYKVYISTLTAISLDDHNWIPTRDNRLLRRIIRDYIKGAFTARETIAQWPSVCEGEEKWIYPYQENADVMFNSALNIEFAVLRLHAEPILASVPKNCPEYSEAHRLMKFIHYFIPVPDKEIPPTSIMREFVGGSSFKY